MYEFTETIPIAVPPAAVWQRLCDIEGWWLPSNPEHISLERLDGRGIQPGARIRIRERVAGIPGEATGEFTTVEPPSAATWEAPRARYRWLGMTVTVSEGVTWRVQPDGGGASRLSARVWASFPAGAAGRIIEWIFIHVLNGVERDREHARTELRYLRGILEPRQ